MTPDKASVLIVDDDEDILIAGRLLLKRHFAEVITCNHPTKIDDLLARHNFDAILLDMNFSPGDSSGGQGFLWLRRILELDPEAVVVMITAHGGVDVAVEAMKRGATDFIAKPWHNEKVVATLSASVKLRRSRNEAAHLKRAKRELADMVASPKQPMLGNSPPMMHVHSLIERAGPTDANVLVLGENGTGKELVARAIHLQSSRRHEVFMSVDLGALTESLFESELFGHVKGAFTDAREDRIGRLQAAQGGTLFLDEIGNVPLHLQARLLTVLEQRQFQPVGANRLVDLDVRVIAATNLSREELANEERFRQDLLFRLNTVEILLPPLRDRREDIPQIANHYVEYYCQKYGKEHREMSPTAMSAIMADEWRGNIRALRHAVERAVILSHGSQLEVHDFQLSSKNVLTSEPSVKTETGVSSGDLNLESIERATVERALKTCHYNISHAARALGLTRAALYRRMEKYGL